MNILYVQYRVVFLILDKTQSCFPYIVVLDCICEYTIFTIWSCFPYLVILDCISEYTLCTIQSCISFIGYKTELLLLKMIYSMELLPLFGDIILRLSIYYMYNKESSSLYWIHNMEWRLLYCVL